MVLTLAAELARALHGSGAPSHVIEASVQELFAAHRVEGSVVASPTAVWLEVGQSSRILRVEPGDTHLARLAQIHAWHERAIESPDAARDLQALLQLRSVELPWGPAWTGVGFAGSAAMAGWLIGGSAVDLVVSAVGGALVLAVSTRLADPAWRPLSLLVIGAVSGLLGGLAAVFGGSAAAVALASMIVVVPGLGMTLALAEVAAGHWSSGGARLLGALAAAAQLAGGVAIGAAAVSGLPVAEAAPSLPGAAWVVPVVGPLAFAVLLEAPRAAMPLIAAVSALAFAVASGIGGPLGAGLAALFVGVCGNASARARWLPAPALSVPGILLLVPGSVGVRGVGELLSRDALAGTQTAFDALSAAGALALGLLAAHALLPGRGGRASAVTSTAMSGARS